MARSKEDSVYKNVGARRGCYSVRTHGGKACSDKMLNRELCKYQYTGHRG